GRFLALVEGRLQGEQDFYEGVFSSLGVELGPAPTAPVPTDQAPSAAATAPAIAAPGSAPDEQMLQAVHAASTLVHRFRSHGHLAAHLDPLGSEPEGEPQLDPEAAGLTPHVMAQIPARILRMYVPGETLAEVDALERFMHKAYLGQHQFSIEGLDMTVPMLDELIQLAAGHGGHEVVVGMAHRGRLNVLAHNLGRPYDTIFAEFEGASTLEAVTTIPQGGTGDVKYHHGT